MVLLYLDVWCIETWLLDNIKSLYWSWLLLTQTEIYANGYKLQILISTIHASYIPVHVQSILWQSSETCIVMRTLFLFAYQFLLMQYFVLHILWTVFTVAFISIHRIRLIDGLLVVTILAVFGDDWSLEEYIPFVLSALDSLPIPIWAASFA